MGTPRFRPSSLFANPRDFGRNGAARPLASPPLQGGQIAWAWYQHQVALEVLAALKKQRRRIDHLALSLGENPDWITRKLYGRVPADLGEMFEWQAACSAENVATPEQTRHTALAD